MLIRLTNIAICLVTLTIGSMISSQGLAADPPGPKVDTFKGYLINEDNGKMSKNVATQTGQIVANGENGTGTQIIVDVWLKGLKNQVYNNSPFLYVVVTGLDWKQGDPPMVDIGFPVNYIGETGQTVRTLVVDHNCNGFTIEAYTMIGDKRISELTKTFNITCGD